MLCRISMAMCQQSHVIRTVRQAMLVVASTQTVGVLVLTIRPYYTVAQKKPNPLLPGMATVTDNLTKKVTSTTEIRTHSCC